MDLHEPGIAVLKANGAMVRKAGDVLHRLVGRTKWQLLEPETRLRTGDQLYIPLSAYLSIVHEDFEINLEPLKHKEKTIEGVNATLVSTTGDDAMTVVDRNYRKKGTISLRGMLKAEQAGLFESKGVDDKAKRRILTYNITPNSVYTPSLKEINRTNKDFEGLHIGMPPPEYEGNPDDWDPEKETKKF
ncbi:MAG: hypothetical protein ACR2QW_13955 [bacterium]